MIFDAATDPVTIVQTGGVVGLLLVILLTGLKGMWVPGWRYREVLDELKEWKQLALKSHNLLESYDEIQRRKAGL